MARAIRETSRSVVPDPAKRGYHAVYRENITNHCPGCGRSHWYVGRITAECGFCGTALPLALATTRGHGSPIRSNWAVVASAA